MPALTSTKNKTKDLTHGPIGRQLFWFSLPLFAGSLIQQLYSTVDLIFVGRVLGKDAAAAVGASTFIIIIILGFFIGLSVGIGVIAAREFARGEFENLSRVVHCTAGLTIIFSIVFTILGIIFAPTVLELMNTPPEIMHWGTVYIRLFMLSLFSIVSYNVGSGILRALGNSLSPMIYQLIGGIANVIGNFLFVYYWNFGISGSAMATVVSQTLAAGLVIYHLYNMDARYCLRFKKITLDLPLAREIFRIGIPAAIQTIVITLSNIVVQTNINGLGVNSIAAYAAYFKVENVIYLPIMALGAGLLHLYQPERWRWQNYAQQARNCHFHLFRPCGYCSKHKPGAVFCRFCFRHVYRRRRGYRYRQQHCLCYYAVLLLICFPRGACFVNPRQRQHFADDGYYSGKYVRYPHWRIKINYVF